MSVGPILSTLDVLIKLGSEIKTRVDSYPRAAEDLQLLDTELRLFVTLFQNPANKDIPLMPEFRNLPDILESIANLCAQCAKALDIDLAAKATTETKTGPHGKSIFKRFWVYYKSPGLLAEIHRKAEQLHYIYHTITTVIIQNIATTQQEQTSGKEVFKANPVAQTTIPENLLHQDPSTGSANIDQILGSLMKECKFLQKRLQEAIIFPDPSAVQGYQEKNPEGASFWRDRFQKHELSASALRYESLYVSWARFVHEVETSFVLNKIPTGISERGDIDFIRKKGSWYYIDQSGTRRLSAIRPLWLPALRSALDPLHKGYVKPQNYFNLLQDSSLSDALRRLTLQNAGYGILVECERASGDLALPASMGSSDHNGWTAAQIVAVPTPDELGIVSEREVMESGGHGLFAHFSNITQDVKVYVRYLQTGQIQRKSLSKQVRPIGGISIGAALSIRHDLESGDHAWSCDYHITEFRACYGGEYIITANGGRKTIVFSTKPLKNSFDKMLRDDNNSSSSTIPEFDCSLLGPSKVFIDPPKVGEKIQIEHDGFWYDSRVTVVDGEEIEYTDWESLPKQAPANIVEAQDDSERDEEERGAVPFSEAELRQLGKGKRRLWRMWHLKDHPWSYVRPYRCFHIGDSVEAPVMYPDYRLHYHITDNSQVYLPARIIDVKGDQYVIQFSPAFSVLEWWPGRIPKGTPIDLVPGSDLKVENPIDHLNRATVHMDRVRPLSAGPRPVLGIQSAKPSGWSSFQGVHLSNLEDLLEQSLWNNDRDDQRTFGQRDWRLFES